MRELPTCIVSFTDKVNEENQAFVFEDWLLVIVFCSKLLTDLIGHRLVE